MEPPTERDKSLQYGGRSKGGKGGKVTYSGHFLSLEGGGSVNRSVCVACQLTTQDSLTDFFEFSHFRFSN